MASTKNRKTYITLFHEDSKWSYNFNGIIHSFLTFHNAAVSCLKRKHNISYNIAEAICGRQGVFYYNGFWSFFSDGRLLTYTTCIMAVEGYLMFNHNMSPNEAVDIFNKR